jgi:hypothetical protein
MKRNRILETIGFRYIVNHRTCEIHRVDNPHVNCQISRLKDGKYCTWLWHWILLWSGYNGCYWCNRKENKEE